MEKVLRRNISNIFFMSFFQNAMIITAVFVPLMQRHGLSMTEVLQTQSWFALVVAFSEVPSGYLADVWGRKNTITVGAFLCVTAFLYLIIADSFFDFLVYEFIMAIGISLNSGADLALLYDSQGLLNKSDNTKNHLDSNRHISRLVTIEGFGGGVAALLASLLTMLSLDWVLWAQALIGMMSLYFASQLVEAPRQISTANHRENIQQVGIAIFDNPLVLWTGLAIVIFSLSALYSFWLYQKYWELQSIPVYWFGYIWAAFCVVRGISAHFANSFERWLGPRRLFVLIAAMPIIGFVGMGSVGGWVGIALGLAFPLSRGISLVVFYAALNKRLSAEFRATVNSLVSLGTRGIFIVTGPLLGMIVDRQGVQNSLLVLAALFVPLFALVLFFLSKKIAGDKMKPEVVLEFDG